MGLAGADSRDRRRHGDSLSGGPPLGVRREVGDDGRRVKSRARWSECSAAMVADWGPCRTISGGTGQWGAQFQRAGVGVQKWWLSLLGDTGDG